MDLEAYERLKRARKTDRESLSQVIKRATGRPTQGEAASMPEMSRSHDLLGHSLESAALDQLEMNQGSDTPAPSKWEP